MVLHYNNNDALLMNFGLTSFHCVPFRRDQQQKNEDVIITGRYAPIAGIGHHPGIHPSNGDIQDPTVTPSRTPYRSRSNRVDIAVQTCIASKPSSPVHRDHDHNRYGRSPSPRNQYHRSVSYQDFIQIFIYRNLRLQYGETWVNISTRIFSLNEVLL